MLGLLLLVVAWHLALGLGVRERPYEVLFVSVPVFRHADPLLEIARQVGEGNQRGGKSNRRRVRLWMALPSCFINVLYDERWELDIRKHIELVKLDNVPCFDHFGNMTLLQLREKYEKTMTLDLLHKFSKGSADLTAASSIQLRVPFDMVVSDRYTLAGYNFAHSFSLPLVIHNPWSMLDIDDPPGYVSCPRGLQVGSGHSQYKSFYSDDAAQVIEKLFNWWARIQFAVQLEHVAKESFRHVRAALGLEQLALHPGHCVSRLVLSDTVLGWFDEPRPLPPLQQTIGPALPQELVPGLHVSPEGKRQPLFNEEPFLDSKQGTCEEEERELEEGCAARNDASSTEWTKKSNVKTMLALGMFPPGELDVLREVCKDLNLNLRYSGERCLNQSMLDSCSAFPRPNGAPAQVEEMILYSNGDMACVQLAAMCGNFAGLVLRPVLAEHEEVAYQAVRNAFGVVLRGRRVTREQVFAKVRAVLVSSRDMSKQLEQLSNALRLSGGAKHAAHWILAVLELGITRFLPLECQLPWYQRHLLDVYFFYFCVLVSIAFIFRSSIAVLFAPYDDVESELKADFEGFADGSTSMDVHTLSAPQDSLVSNNSNGKVNGKTEMQGRSTRESTTSRNREFSYERVVM